MSEDTLDKIHTLLPRLSIADYEDCLQDARVAQLLGEDPLEAVRKYLSGTAEIMMTRLRTGAIVKHSQEGDNELLYTNETKAPQSIHSFKYGRNFYLRTEKTRNNLRPHCTRDLFTDLMVMDAIGDKKYHRKKLTRKESYRRWAEFLQSKP